ncbi:MAG: 4-alpha-glucanotransferase [Candidatus Gastranaerophilaceae bacterium]
MKGWCLGCPPDYFSKDGQAWGFPVMDPERLYNADGSWTRRSIIEKSLQKMFEKIGGVRIDHIVGLIDPWVYKAIKKPKIEQGAGRLYSSRNIQNFQNMQLQKLKIWIWSLPLTKKKELRL